VIIDVNQDYRDGRDAAFERILRLASISLSKEGIAVKDRLPTRIGSTATTFLKATLPGQVLRDMVSQDESEGGKNHNAIYKIWDDFEVRALITRSVSTVKADAAQMAFLASGQDIVWAVLDSGIDAAHAHFVEKKNLNLALPLAHKDYTGGNNPLRDDLGHGTHVAGIIAGSISTAPPGLKAIRKTRNSQDQIVEEQQDITHISGMAPVCSLLSMKVLDARGRGQMSNILTALDDIQKINDYGRRLLIHGLNLSAGYDFDPEWFACGQSPLCIAINRLVRSGVVVVVAAGNTGYGLQQSNRGDLVAAGLSLTINDPGNADLAITVGATHRDMPHIYGVSYFSSKGPTGDGRNKPDLVAPGEKILSCAAGQHSIVNAEGLSVGYIEDSGTSMAAPHVSGLIAAFLSIRREYIGQPEDVKRIFMKSATDLGRDRTFQGSGLVDLMRAIQSV
jgi:serine protease AprX